MGMKGLKISLCKENGGILLLEEDDLFEPGNSDALVINCGPLNATYAVFLNKHRNKIYAPSLVFAALGAQALKVSDDFIFNLHNTGWFAYIYISLSIPNRI